MNKNMMYLENYKSVSDEVKYLTNSVVRLKILALLYDKPMKMKEINDSISGSYSSISGNMHDLELAGYIYRKSNKYCLSNSAMILIKNIIEIDQLLDIVNRFYNIFNEHVVDVIPEESILELYMVNDSDLIESDNIDVYKTFNYIEKSMENANRVKSIMPFYHENLNRILNNLVKEKKSVEALVSSEIYEIFEENSEIKKVFSYEKENNFFLISTDNVMILGLFSNDGKFDQNRLLISQNKNSVKWAENLFGNFKIKYK